MCFVQMSFLLVVDIYHSHMALVVLVSCKVWVWVTLWRLKVNFSCLPCYLAGIFGMVHFCSRFCSGCKCCVHSSCVCMSFFVAKVTEECALLYICWCCGQVPHMLSSMRLICCFLNFSLYNYLSMICHPWC